MWSPEIVRARFSEAAATERFLPIDRLGTGAGYWPRHFYEPEDREGWDDVAKLDNAARPASRAPDGAIARHWECMRWTTERIDDEHRRHLVWAFARCRAFGWDFSSLCNRRGWKKSTAYDRLNKLWDRLSLEFCRQGIYLHPPTDDWLGHEGAFDVGSSGTQDNSANKTEAVRYSPSAIKFTPSFRTEDSRDLIQTQDDADAFAKMLERRNARLRKLNAWRNEEVA
ncbi:hypothetical protein ABIF26_006432 [Bradyrhizobium elkanii]|uniref:hypothetical protein n=1 Tax=Bradyrhizobium elkanii TaxID=29448 RepID=UPI003514F2EB